MAEHIKLSEEMLKNAEDYLNLSVKEGMARYFAIACVQEEDGIFRENTGLKQRFLMGVLAGCYLKQEYERQEAAVEVNGKIQKGVLDNCMTHESYDRWAGSHIFSQLNRFVRDRQSEVSDKAYEIINDHRTLVLMLDKEIEHRLRQGNDPLRRAVEALQSYTGNEISGEMLEELKRRVEAERAGEDRE